MDIETLSKEVYVDLNGKILSVEDNNEEMMSIIYECDNWKNHDERIKFQVDCSDVIESQVIKSVSDEIVFTDKHPLLLKYNELHGCLFFSSRPQNYYEVLGILWATHENLFNGWRSLSEYINTPHEVYEGSFGKIAEGPISLLEAYKEALQDKMKLNIVTTYDRPVDNYKALVFDDCYLICKNVKVNQII